MRVIAGKFKSRTLRTLRGMALRPTSDRLRETLFNILGSAILGAAVEGSVFVDVFAGTGAMGIEALSRGAREVYFVENHAAAVNLIRKNLESLGVRSEAEILAMDAVRGLKELAKRGVRADFIFLDPPYARDEEYARLLKFIAAAELLASKGTVVAEHAKKLKLPEETEGLARTRVVTQGDSALSFYRMAVSQSV